MTMTIHLATLTPATVTLPIPGWLARALVRWGGA
jgi:hypothetical protein